MYFHSFNSKSLSAALLGFAFALVSCKKDLPPIFKDGHFHSGKTVVLVAGYESNGTNNVAKCWMDGQEIKLSDGTYDASANSVFVSNNDSYVAGSDNGAVYWKNNYEIRLSGNDASSIFVSGNDVYVAGSDGPNAVYWKNGTEEPLVNNNLYGDYGGAVVKSIFVSGSDVYAAGYEGPNAVYWKNGTEIYLTATTTVVAGFVHASSIYVSGHDVHIVAYNNSAGALFSELWYWKNEVLVPINTVNNYGQANSVFVSGSDVYIGGTHESSPTFVPTAAYWKNGNVVLLPKSQTYSFGNAVFASGNHVYVAGYEYASGQDKFAVYWKDGIETKLTDGTHDAHANSIFIK